MNEPSTPEPHIIDMIHPPDITFDSDGPEIVDFVASPSPQSRPKPEPEPSQNERLHTSYLAEVLALQEELYKLENDNADLKDQNKELLDMRYSDLVRIKRLEEQLEGVKASFGNSNEKWQNVAYTQLGETQSLVKDLKTTEEMLYEVTKANAAMPRSGTETAGHEQSGLEYPAAEPNREHLMDQMRALRTKAERMYRSAKVFMHELLGEGFDDELQNQNTSSKRTRLS